MRNPVKITTVRVNAVFLLELRDEGCAGSVQQLDEPTGPVADRDQPRFGHVGLSKTVFHMENRAENICFLVRNLSQIPDER